MKFFVPLCNNPDHGDQLYETARGRLRETKEAPADRRIYVLKFEEEGKRRTIAVGDEFHKLADGPVVAILQGSTTSTFYICTPKHGAFEGEPYPVSGEATLEVEEFTAIR